MKYGLPWALFLLKLGALIDYHCLFVPVQYIKVNKGIWFVKSKKSTVLAKL